MKIKLSYNFNNIVSIDNLLCAWKEFIRGKRNKKDVQEFSFNLMDNILSLHQELINYNYKHGGYQAFRIYDPKLRDINKAAVKDRLIHHAIYRVLYPFFDTTFIFDSYSCRLGKGTHKAINRFHLFFYKVGNNNTKTCWILKCDIRKFFASIDHKILADILEKHITDKNTSRLLREIINSFYSFKPGTGLPLGNLTSQLLVNIYMNEFDQFIKHKLRAKYYIRYVDDFVILSNNYNWLKNQITYIQSFLNHKLKLTLHPNKVSIDTLYSGIDYLGWVNFPDHRILKTITKKRMIKRIEINLSPKTINSYFGLLKHGNTYILRDKIFKILDFREDL